jgi:hypothetical protein
MYEPVGFQIVTARVLDEPNGGQVCLVIAGQIPHRANLLVFAQELGQMVLIACQDVDYAGHVGSLQNLLEQERHCILLNISNFEVANRGTSYKSMTGNGAFSSAITTTLFPFAIAPIVCTIKDKSGF